LAYEVRWQRDHQTKDPSDLYLEIKEREEARRTKGLPPRVVMLPDWDIFSDLRPALCLCHKAWSVRVEVIFLTLLQLGRSWWT
jgi:hypothetical protein